MTIQAIIAIIAIVSVPTLVFVLAACRMSGLITQEERER